MLAKSCLQTVTACLCVRECLCVCVSVCVHAFNTPLRTLA